MPRTLTIPGVAAIATIRVSYRPPLARQLARMQEYLRSWPITAVLTAATVALLLASPAIASGLAKPSGEILLTVSGNISKTNHTKGAAFDLQMLESLETTSFVTETPWTEGPTKFTGVTLKLLLETVGAESHIISLIAEDGYLYELDRPIDDKHPVIIAYKKNDEYMSLRQLGPLWLMFPFDDFPKLLTEENKAASVWQLTHMELK